MDYAYIIRKESIQNNTWLTPKELELIKKKKEQMLEKAREEKRQQKVDEENRKKEENDLRIKKQVMELREYIKQGYTYKEISGNMCYSVAYLGYLRKLAVAENIWFTRAEIRDFRNLREKREQLEEEKNRIEEQKRLEEEHKAKEKAMKEEEERRNIERKQKIKEYKRLYDVCKKEAKKEDKLELKRKENVSTEGRRKFIEVLVTLQNLDVYINDEDIDIVLNTFYMYPEIANKDSIKFLISDASKSRGKYRFE